MFIVLLETSGNQRYIFSTNKLRENVGASELTYQIGTSVVEKYLEEINKSTNNAIEPIITTSGKALLSVSGKDDLTARKTAEEIVRKVTTYALKEMPGLTVHGAICKVESCEKADKSDEADKFHKAVGDVHKRLEEIRYRIPSNLQRFQRIPFVAECASSNLPAQDVKIFYDKRGKEVERKVFSQAISAKRNVLVKLESSEFNNEDFKKSRIVRELEEFQLELFEDLEKLEKNFKKQADWLAVVHADGNGLGQIFLKFDEHADMSSSETYKKDYKEFSHEIDTCTKNAFGKALQKLQEKFGSYSIPVVPLVIGGDDLTFICDGEYAISLTKDFLQNFETECVNNPVIKRLTTKDGKEIPLGICAGIAIIKPKFPFHQAYDLAEKLLQSAKKTKQISTSLSAFDYHVLYDSSGTTLEEIRAKTPFVARPYVVSENAEKLVENEEKLTKEEKETGKIWVKNHHFSELSIRVETMNEEEDGKRKLPNSQMHVLREGLFVADTTLDIQKEVDARAKLIAHRYEKEGFDKLFVKDKSLFFDAVLSDKIEDENETKRTHFLDALDIVEFWK